MKSPLKNRGSALMLVVGLLTIIAMLGSTFLISSYLEAQQAEVFLSKSSAAPLSTGVMSTVQQILKIDKYITQALGPYGLLTRSPDGWNLYLDTPGEKMDAWLTEYSEEAGAWWSQPFGKQPSVGTADTDGDDVPDARLYNVQVMNNKGDSFYVAIRIVDTSGLICVNRAGEPTPFVKEVGLAGLFDPAMVNLSSFLGDEVYAAVHRGRCGGTGSITLKDYTKNCGRRLLSPVSGYKPFPFSDEVVLRRLVVGEEAERSKLFELLSDQGNKMPSLTTISSSMSTMRYPGADGVVARIPIYDRTALDDYAKLVHLQAELKDIIGEPDKNAGAGTPPIVKDNALVGGLDWLRKNDPEAYNGDYLQNGATAAKGSVQSYALMVLEAGDYALYATAPGGAGNSPAVPVSVLYFSGGAPVMRSFTWDQTTASAGTWVGLAVLEDLAPGPVSVSIGTIGTNGFIVNADAVKLEKIQSIETSPESTHLVANMWAYLSKDGDELTGSFNVSSLVDATWVAYGVVPQLVISEVYAHRSIQPITNAQQWAFAVELLNQTDKELDVSNYMLKCGADTWVFPPALSLAPGERIVLYTADVASGGTALNPGDFFPTMPGRWESCDALRNFPSQKIEIQRATSTAVIPVDSVMAGEIGVLSDGTVDASRDDDMDRQRCLIPKYVVETIDKTQHTLGEANALDDAQLGQFSEVMEGFYIRRLAEDKDAPDSVGDFGDCYVVGPDSTGVDLPHKLYPIDEDTGQLDQTKRHYFNDLSRGRAHIGFTNPNSTAYPDVPWATLLAELLEFVPPDTKDGMNPHRRIYGRININTALIDALRALPYPQTISWTDSDGNPHEENVDPDAAAQAILNYRNSVTRNAYTYLVDGSYQSNGANGDVPILREHDKSAVKGFFTPGEIAIPLAMYAEQLMNVSNDDRKKAWYLDARNELYRYVISSVTVNSDTFAVTAVVNIDNPPRQTTSYVALLDRSGCIDRDDSPSILFMAEVK